MSMIVLVALLSFTVGWFVGAMCVITSWKNEAAKGHFTIGDKLYRAEEVKP